MQVEFGCSHPFVSALLLKLRAEDRAAGIDDYDVGAAVNGQIDKRDRYCHAHMVIQDTTPRQYCSGRGKLEGWFYGQFQETLGAWQMFCLFEAAPNATRTVPLSLERGSVFLLPGSAEPAVLVAILVGSKPPASFRGTYIPMGVALRGSLFIRGVELRYVGCGTPARTWSGPAHVALRLHQEGGKMNISGAAFTARGRRGKLG